MEPKPGPYRHFKGGVYRVIGVATHSETGEDLVVYRGTLDGRLWVRPRAMFRGQVLVDGVAVARFAPIGEGNDR